MALCAVGADVGSEVQCKQAASAMGKTYSKSGSWSDWPTGCYYSTKTVLGLGAGVYFNTYSPTAGNLEATPICVLTPSPTPSPTKLATPVPTLAPTTLVPTTLVPTTTLAPTLGPSERPTVRPTDVPTPAPTTTPTASPTLTLMAGAPSCPHRQHEHRQTHSSLPRRLRQWRLQSLTRSLTHSLTYAQTRAWRRQLVPLVTVRICVRRNGQRRLPAEFDAHRRRGGVRWRCSVFAISFNRV